jgi:large subunit ribosomal protein L22
MGARKRTTAEQRKSQTGNIARAVLANCPTSPRKMRLVVDMIRGVEVNRALDILRYSPKEASRKVEKLLLSAIANWQSKHEDERIEKSNLFVKEVFVDGGRTLKRLRPAPQGRGYRIRKRSNHVTIIVDSLTKNEVQAESQTK